MSELREGIHAYLTMRRALGFRLRGYDAQLEDFASFVERDGGERISSAAAVRWATNCHDHSPQTRACRLNVVRGFARYWHASNPRSEIPPTGLLPGGRSRRTPYLYTDKEVARLMRGATSLRTRSPLWRATLKTLVGLLAATGMRHGEVLALNQEDVDWNEALVVVRRTKFDKSRLVPIHLSTRSALRRYARHRDRAWPPSPQAPFFPSPTGKRIKQGQVHRCFGEILRAIELAWPPDRHRPRLHDLRHRFAVDTLVRWYREGRDPARHMLALSTYLGHTDVSHTYWYLSASPELMGLACGRLERALGRLP